MNHIFGIESHRTEEQYFIYILFSSLVLVVRHPFVRLFSAWNEKFSRLHRHAAHYYKTARGLREFETDNWSANQTSTHLVSFRNFITWIAKNEKSKNPHFESALKLCPPCQNFNFVIKVETMKMDLPAMFSSKNFTIPENWVLEEPRRNFGGGFSNKNLNHTIEKIQRSYGPIPSDILNLLVEKFKPDLDFFGYTFDIDSRTPGGFL